MPDVGDVDELWQALLTGTHPLLRRHRRLLRLIPAAPRCKLCNAPFHGIGLPLMRLVGKRPSNMNPLYCNVCEEVAREHRGGAEIELTLLFADVRGSTALAERMNPTAFTELMNRFYATAGRIFTQSDAMIDKLIGDEVVALYLPAFAGPAHARRAIDDARALLHATGHGNPEGPWLPVGVGIHTGIAFVGSVGPPGGFTDFTALGDAVNVAARFASLAESGEILVSSTSRDSAGGTAANAEPKRLRVSGREAPVEAESLRVSAAPRSSV